MKSIPEWSLAKEESVCGCGWVYHFWEYSSQFWIRYLGWWRAVESWSVSGWHLDSDSCGRRIFRVSPGIMIAAEMVTVWPLIGHPWPLICQRVQWVFWWQKGSKPISNVNTGHHKDQTNIGREFWTEVVKWRKECHNVWKYPLYLLLWGQFGFIHRISRLFWFFTPSVQREAVFYLSVSLVMLWSLNKMNRVIPIHPASHPSGLIIRANILWN